MRYWSCGNGDPGRALCSSLAPEATGLGRSVQLFALLSLFIIAAACSYSAPAAFSQVPVRIACRRRAVRIW